MRNLQAKVHCCAHYRVSVGLNAACSGSRHRAALNMLNATPQPPEMKSLTRHEPRIPHGECCDANGVFVIHRHKGMCGILFLTIAAREVLLAGDIKTMPSLLALPASGTLLAIAWEFSPDRWINHATNPTRCAIKSAAQLKNSIITPMGRTLGVARAGGEVLHYAMQFSPALHRATVLPAGMI